MVEIVSAYQMAPYSLVQCTTLDHSPIGYRHHIGNRRTFAMMAMIYLDKAHPVSFYPIQKTLKEKEFELFTLKTQKLEKLCRALQEERNSLSHKLQEANPAAANSAKSSKNKPFSSEFHRPPHTQPIPLQNHTTQ